MSVVEPKYRVVVMGKTGSGKSSVCNRLIGQKDDEVFPVYSGMGGRTTQIKSHKAVIDSTCIEVVDTPDFFSMGHDVSSARAAFRAWDEAGPSSMPTAIIFTVPMDGRFSSEDNKLYNEKYMNILPVKYRKSIIIACTKMKNFVGIVEHRVRELHTLKNLWDAAEGRHIEFRDIADAPQLQRDLIAVIDAMRMEDGIGKNTTVQELKVKIFWITYYIYTLFVRIFVAVFCYIKIIAEGIAVLMVEYIVKPGTTIAVCMVFFCRTNPKIAFPTLFCVVLFSVCWITFIQSQEEENAKQPQKENQTDIAKSPLKKLLFYH